MQLELASVRHPHTPAAWLKKVSAQPDSLAMSARQSDGARAYEAGSMAQCARAAQLARATERGRADRQRCAIGS